MALDRIHPARSALLAKKPAKLLIQAAWRPQIVDLRQAAARARRKSQLTIPIKTGTPTRGNGRNRFSGFASVCRAVRYLVPAVDDPLGFCHSGLHPAQRSVGAGC